MKKLTNDEYKMLLANHNSSLTLLSEYKSMPDKVRIKDEDGIVYNVVARSALLNNKLNIKSAEDKTLAFSIKLHKIQPNIRLISKYIQGNIKCIFVDELNIEYLIKPESLLLGRKPSIVTAIDKNDAFMKKANNVHKYRYDYSKSVYTNDKHKLIIICEKHGKFTQQPNNHVNQEQGCPKCNSARGYTKSEWLSYTNNKECVFYIIKCFNNTEIFIKAGITVNGTKRRFQSNREMPYEYSILKEYIGDGNCVWDLEREFSELCRDYKYLPLLKFHGRTECYNIKLTNILKLK